MRLAATLQGALLGLVCGFAAALALGQWVWLEMRVVTGYAIPLGLTLGAALGAWRGRPFTCRSLILAELVLAVLFVALYGLDVGALSVVPACAVREGCLLGSTPLAWVNLALGAVFLAGNLVWILGRMRRGSCPVP